MRISCILLLWAVLAPMVADPVHAQDAEPRAAEPDDDAAAPTVAGEAIDSGEMVVAAQRYTQDAQKTPVSVDAFSPRTMDQRGIVNLQDVGKFTPNLQLQPTTRPAGGGSAYAAFIRGIGTGDFQFPTDPGVGLYVDDVYIARTIGGLMSTDSDIERIELIKGPQGTLFGRNTIGGAINILTSKPRLSEGGTGTALVRLGDYGRRDLALSANGPLLENVIGAKLSVASLHLDGYGKRVLDGQRTNGEDRLVIRGGMLFKLSDDVNIRLDGDFSHQAESPPTGLMLGFAPSAMAMAKIDKYNMIAAPVLNPGLRQPAGSIYDARWVTPGDYKTYALQPMYDRYDLGGGSARLEWKASEAFNFKSITAARSLGSDIAVDGDQTPYPIQSSHTTLNSQQYSQEFQFTGDVFDDRLTYMFGLYAFRETGDSQVSSESFHGLFENETMKSPADAGDTFTKFSLTATSYAAFTQETLRIIDELHLTAGARINHDEKDYSYGVLATQTGMQSIPETHATASWNSFTPKVGLDWSPIEPMLVYASLGQGVKSGGFSASNSAANPAPKYGPERVTAYELGLKTHWFEHRRLITNLAGFYNDYRDIQLTVQYADPMTSRPVRSTQNAGDSAIKGFEAEVVAMPVEGLSFIAGVGYTHARFDRVATLDLVTKQPLMGLPAIGDRLPLIPDWSVNAGAQYGFGVGVGELTLRGDVSFRSATQLTAADPTSKQAGYALYAARIAFVPKGLEQLEVSLYGINLADQRYYVYHATIAPTGQEIAVPGSPRLIYGSAKYMF